MATSASEISFNYLSLHIPINISKFNNKQNQIGSDSSSLRSSISSKKQGSPLIPGVVKGERADDGKEHCRSIDVRKSEDRVK